MALLWHLHVHTSQHLQLFHGSSPDVALHTAINHMITVMKQQILQCYTPSEWDSTYWSNTVITCVIAVYNVQSGLETPNDCTINTQTFCIPGIVLHFLWHWVQWRVQTINVVAPLAPITLHHQMLPGGQVAHATPACSKPGGTQRQNIWRPTQKVHKPEHCV